MKKKYMTIAMSAAILFGCVSCDSFLDVHPKNLTIPETTDDYSKLMCAGVIVKTIEDNPMLMTDDVHMLYIDEDWITFGYFYSPGSDKNLYTFQDEIYGMNNTDPLWTYSYRRINTYNIVADNVMNSSEGQDKEKEALRGEALTGRAYEYLQLINAYARAYQLSTAKSDPGLPLMLSGDLNIAESTRASVQDVYSRIEDDLEEALTLLNEQPSPNIYRASIPAAHGLLARMYLFMDNYSEALKQSKLCLDYSKRLRVTIHFCFVQIISYIISLPIDEAVVLQMLHRRRLG